jgi:hypothetical protein
VRIPIACNLNEQAASDRREEWRAALQSSVRATSRTAPGRVDLRLADGPVAAGRLVDLARREKACCEFFTFAVEIDTEGATMVVQVPDDAAGVLDDFIGLLGS